jgi:hypothetical protein
MIMNKLKNLFKNELFILLINGVIIHTAFVAVVLSVYGGAPEVLLDSELAAIIEIFEG